jgi:hypothetical protein
MASLTSPIEVQAGQLTIDHSIVPAIRNIKVEFSAHDLKPYVAANCFFDDTYVNPFIQAASVITPNIGSFANVFTSGDGLYNNATHAYVEVIDTSQANNILYVNENFISLNLVPYGPVNSNTFASNDYKAGDIVYQSGAKANSESNTALGTVVFWNYKDGALVIELNNGIVNANTNTAAQILYKLGYPVTANGGIANVTGIVHGNKFPLTSQVTNTGNVNQNFLVSSYVSNHGIVTVSQNGAAALINVNGQVANSAVNSTISIVSGDGIGQSAKIISVNGNMLTLNTALAFPLYTATGKQLAAGYAIGSPVVDDIGRVAGIFNIPEDQNLYFNTGNRLFTINDGVSYDDPDASMRATAIFAAAGSIAPPSTTAQTPVVSGQQTLAAQANGVTAVQSSVTQGSVSNGTSNDPQASPDPLAQTFTVPTPNTAKQSYGIYCTSIDLFFQQAPTGNATQFPVTVRLVSTDNGLPTSTVLASATVECADVRVTPGYNAESNTGVYPDSTNTATITKFSFGDPVYLAPATEYAIVVYSESPDYEVWIANTGAPAVNSGSLVSQGNYVGNFFEAQNSSAWNPIPGAMLMFVLNKAQFSLTPVSLQFAAESPTQNTYMDLAVLHSSDLTFPVANIDYSILTTIANTGQPDTGYLEIEPNQVYNFGADLQQSSLASNRRRVVNAGNGSSTIVQATLYTNDPDVSPIFNAERLSLLAVTNLINDGSLAASDISITSGGNHINAANIVVTIGAPTGDNPLQATANVTSLNANAVVGINIINPGSGYITSPSITISEAGAPANATAVVNGENGVSGGNGDTRYITKTITLANGFAAGDLQVFVDCIRPQGTDIEVYYKVNGVSDTQPIDGKSWQIMTLAQNLFSTDQTNQITLNFNTGGSGVLSYVQNGITYPLGGQFQQFAIKIVLLANDPTVPPLVQALRGVAIPAG